MPLRPCPLCGMPAEMEDHPPIRPNCQRNYTVACSYWCDGGRAHAWGETESDATEDWNTWWGRGRQATQWSW